MPETQYEIGATCHAEFDAIMEMTKRAAVFNETEVDTVTELLEGYEEGPESSGYYFLSCRDKSAVVGYACWGPRDLSGNGYDLYWICADPSVHGQGVGRALMHAVEAEICKRNGVWVVIETSDTEHYAPARRLYERCGYTLAMLLKDFYHDGDGLCTYTKRLR
ncbi:phosphinothricin acetyltransferase [Thermoflexales bacterium]|nr:phosphinothricin acetyltransferase [Thermoflexales bacterium]